MGVVVSCILRWRKKRNHARNTGGKLLLPAHIAEEIMRYLPVQLKQVQIPPTLKFTRRITRYANNHPGLFSVLICQYKYTNFGATEERFGLLIDVRENHVRRSTCFRRNHHIVWMDSHVLT